MATTLNGVGYPEGGRSDPLKEAVTIRIGTFSKTIPAGSFKQDSAGFLFAGRVDGLRMYVVLRLVRGKCYEFYASASYATLTTRNPVNVVLVIGDDSGSANITAEFGPRPK